MKNLKIWSVILSLTIIICLLVTELVPVQAATYSLNKYTLNPVVSSGVSVSNGTVIFDSSVGLYKMWYIQTTADDSIRSSIYSQLNLTPTLVNDIKNGNFSAVAGLSDSTAIKSFLDYLAGLTNTQLNTFMASISTNLKYAYSSNGTTWTDGGSVTFPATSWDQFISSPNVIKDVSSYKMWYTGTSVTATDLHNLFVAIDNASLTPTAISTLLGDIIAGNITQLRSDIVSLSLQSAIWAFLAMR